MLDFLLKNNLLPDNLLKLGIRLQLAKRIKAENALIQSNPKHHQELLDSFKNAPIAIATDASLSQHYAVPTGFFKLVLGQHLKYSAAYWESAKDLHQAEEAMLSLYCERLKIEDGDKILDLGCGWGATTLYIAMRFPKAHVTALSHSKTQADYINDQAKKMRLTNIKTMTVDINQAELDPVFDKIISIEMFEHVRNHAALLKKLAQALKPGGKLFVHHFCHRKLLYLFENEKSWMAKHFFSGGMMPNFHYLKNFTEDFLLSQYWEINGLHYQKTALAWLDNLNKNKSSIIKLFSENQIQQAELYWQYWRLFFLSCAELFGYNQGRDWFVGHYLLIRKA